jgi:hypothetical protein
MLSSTATGRLQRQSEYKQEQCDSTGQNKQKTKEIKKK